MMNVILYLNEYLWHTRLSLSIPDFGVLVLGTEAWLNVLLNLTLCVENSKFCQFNVLTGMQIYDPKMYSKGTKKIKNTSLHILSLTHTIKT